MEAKLNKDQKIIVKNLGYYQVLGGATGAGFAIYQLMQLESINTTTKFLYLYCLIVCAFSVYGGKLLLEGAYKKGLQCSLLNQVFQVLNFTLSGVSLKFVAGIMMSIGIDFSETFKLVSNFSLSEHLLSFNIDDTSVIISINIVAILLVYLIDKIQKEVEEREIQLEKEDNITYY